MIQNPNYRVLPTLSKRVYVAFGYISARDLQGNPRALPSELIALGHTMLGTSKTYTGALALVKAWRAKDAARTTLIMPRAAR